MVICIHIDGFGNIGRAFTRLLLDNKEILEAYNSRICGVYDSSGGVYQPNGIEWDKLASMLTLPRSSLAKVGKEGLSIDEVAEEMDVVIEVTPSIYDERHVIVRRVVNLLSKGVYIITANKAPLALYPGIIRSYGLPGNQRLYYSATVMAGTPIIYLLQGLRGRIVNKVVAVLNATTNYLLTLIEEGYGFEEAVQRAVREGIAEPNPSLDIDGWDAAAKLAIISTIIGWTRSLNDIVRVSLSSVREEQVREASKRGKRVKYIAYASRKEAIVKPMELNLDEPLAKLKWNLNGVLIDLEEYKIYVEGPGGGPLPTSHALFSDLLNALSTIKVLQ